MGVIPRLTSRSATALPMNPVPPMIATAIIKVSDTLGSPDSRCRPGGH
jgi:hypothetical protein